MSSEQTTLETIQSLIGQRVEVLDKGWLELVDILPHPATQVTPDLAVINAARVSFLGESKGEEADKKLLMYLLKNSHTSPFEMVEFKFRVRAPLVTWWQWARHRTWNFNAQSGRYTPFEESDFYVPTDWRKQSASNKQGSSNELLSKDDAEKIAYMVREVSPELANTWEDTREDGKLEVSDLFEAYADLGYRIYENLLEVGAAKEQARIFLPAFSIYYTWVAKIDAHNLMQFLRLRMDSHAQHEIRVYAQAIHDHFFKPAMPWTAEAFQLYVLK